MKTAFERNLVGFEDEIEGAKVIVVLKGWGS